MVWVALEGILELNVILHFQSGLRDHWNNTGSGSPRCNQQVSRSKIRLKVDQERDLLMFD